MLRECRSNPFYICILYTVCSMPPIENVEVLLENEDRTCCAGSLLLTRIAGFVVQASPAPLTVPKLRQPAAGQQCLMPSNQEYSRVLRPSALLDPQSRVSKENSGIFALQSSISYLWSWSSVSNCTAEKLTDSTVQGRRPAAT